MTRNTPSISLEQWRALVGVVEAGGYAQAAEALHKSQSALTYAIQKIETQLDVRAFEIQGRKAVLTTTGQMLYRRALALLAEAAELEQAAYKASAGWEAEIGLAVEMLFPTAIVLASLAEFGRESPHTRIELIESVIGGTPEALLEGRANLAVTARIPPGFAGDSLIRMPLLAVAHPDHALHRMERPLRFRDLRSHRHLIVRDSSRQRDRRTLSLDVEQRWTVSQMATSIAAVCAGYGFSWFPREAIAAELSDGRLKALPLKEGGERYVELYLVLTDPDFAGPGVRRLAAILRETVQRECARTRGEQTGLNRA
ncbi:MAG: LysR family transcriptional regulator [Gammaproteobacteria bacterium]|nr:LysR family transcriptional regulator [Gammaproteobacteria bacterium]